MDVEADVRLVRACLAGDAAALAVLDGKLREVGGQVARKLRLTDAQRDEAVQAVRKVLLVGTGLATFAGRSDLVTWLRVIATREALRIARAAPREQPADDDALMALVAPDDDPATQHLKARYREEMKRALEDAVATLTDEEKNLLRYHAVDGLSVEDIGKIYGVHRATAARRVEKARELLVSRTRRTLQSRLRVEREELDSILRLIESRFEATLSRLFGTP